MTGKYGVALPYDTEALSRTRQALGCGGAGSPRPAGGAPGPIPAGQRLAVTVCACVRAWCSASSSCCRPTKGVSARAVAALQSARRRWLAPTSSNTSTGSTRPFTGTGPRAVTWTRPCTRRRVAALRRMLPGVAVFFSRCAPPAPWSPRPPSSPYAGRCQWRGGDFPELSPPPRMRSSRPRVRRTSSV